MGGDDLVLVIGPDQAGNLYEIGVVVTEDRPDDRPRHARSAQIPEVNQMPRSAQEILDQADELAKRFESHEPDPDEVLDADALREVRQAFLARAEAERRLGEAVARARADGHSWASIGAMVGTSGEAARQRYGKRTDAPTKG